MIAGSPNPKDRVVLVAAFGSLPDAEAAARFLTDRGVPTKAIGLTKATPNPRSGRAASRSLTRPLIFAAVGGVLIGLAGNMLWSAVAPDFASDGWRIIGPALVGATAAGSIGVAVDNGLELPFQQDRVWEGEGFSPSNRERAVVAVPESHMEDAAGLLRRIGVDRMLVGDE